MKGCVRSCVLSLLGFLAAAAYCFFVLFKGNVSDLGNELPVSAAAGFFLWLTLAFLVGIAQTRREQSMIRRAIDGEPPMDGRRTVLVGMIDSHGQRLRAPLSGADCVAFKYQVYQVVSSGKSTHKKIYYEGIALVPSVISTTRGSLRLLAVPDFDFPMEESLEKEAAIRNLAEYAATTEFAKKPESRPFRPGIEKQWTDDDGAYRRDHKHEDKDVPFEKCVFEEHSVKRGSLVSVFGRYSQQRGGIVPDANWAKPTRIMKGNPEEVLRKLRKRITGYSIGVIVSAAITAGIWFAWQNSHLFE